MRILIATALILISFETFAEELPKPVVAPLNFKNLPGMEGAPQQPHECDAECNRIVEEKFKSAAPFLRLKTPKLQLDQAIPLALPHAVTTPPPPAALPSNTAWSFFGCDGKIKASYIAGGDAGVWYYSNQLELDTAKKALRGWIVGEAVADRYAGTVLQVAKSMGWRGAVAVTGVTATAFAIHDFFNCPASH